MKDIELLRITANGVAGPQLISVSSSDNVNIEIVDVENTTVDKAIDIIDSSMTLHGGD